MWVNDTHARLKYCGRILSWSLIGTTAALAQTSPIDALIRQHERAVQDATRREPLNADAFTPEAPGVGAVSAKPADVTSCSVIQKIRLEGHPDSVGDEPQETIARYMGQCLIAEQVITCSKWYSRAQTGGDVKQSLATECGAEQLFASCRSR